MNVSELVKKSEVLDIWNNYWITDMTNLDAENQLRNLATVELNSAPQLNENQQIAINNAKKSFEKGADLYDCAIDMMLYDGLTDKEWAKATVAFLLWALEQEEE